VIRKCCKHLGKGWLTSTRDVGGQQLFAANAPGAYTLAHDAIGEVTNERGPFGVTLTMAYDADGYRTVVQDNFGGVTTSAYDANGDLTQEETGGTGLTPLRIDISYNAAGEETGETRYSDLAGTTKVATTSFVYDAEGNVTGQVDKTGGGTSIAAYTNIYDADNEITSEQLNGGTPTSYTYDADGEVTGDGVNTPTYDAEGNRTNTGYTTTTGNQLQTDGTWDYKYDAAGNETEKVNIATGIAWTYGYDDKNELVEAEKWSSDPTVYGTAYVEAKIDYKYDALGNEAERDDYPTGTGSPVVTRYEVDGWNPALAGSTGNSRFNVFADLDGSNALQTRYVHGDKIDQLLARIDGAGNAYWTLTDRQGSVRDALDNTGTVKDAINYDAFGNIISESSSTYRGSYAWTGRELDVETDLQYNRARWYDPATSRWMSQDPLGFNAGDSNLYRYTHNQTTTDHDPSGLQILLFVWPVTVPLVGTVKGGHVTIMWVGKNGEWATFEGGGGSLYGTTNETAYIREYKNLNTGKTRTLAHLHVNDFKFLADDPTQANYQKAYNMIKQEPGPNKDWYYYSDHGSAGNNFDKSMAWDVVTSKYPTADDELRALLTTYVKLNQVPYHAPGPNSNTYSHQLLTLSGFTVADRYEEVAWPCNAVEGL
jgi:RHS repeat-associated protein